MEIHDCVVWEGRFQPIHRGHVSYIELLLRRSRKLWIYVVANETSSEAGRSLDDLPVPEFTSVVDRHHGADKNPLPFPVRYDLVVRTIAEEFPGAPITVCGGRRLDLDWELATRLLPQPRVFITPLRDEFEDVKAAAWDKLGEKVERIDVDALPRISGSQLRDALRGGADVSRFLCPSTLRLLEESGHLAALAR